MDYQENPYLTEQEMCLQDETSEDWICETDQW